MKPGDLARIYRREGIVLVLEVDLKDPRISDRAVVLVNGRRRLIFKSLLEVVDEAR